eukprot:GFUD01047174.1.p1 GENE.GFUD01047174.1~~GFUD01047174.1.p1  ORF type:complete len:256 (+),score=98.94 GFUD01047174.1:84-770(+)
MRSFKPVLLLVIIAAWCLHVGEGYNLNRQDGGPEGDGDSAPWESEDGPPPWRQDSPFNWNAVDSMVNSVAEKDEENPAEDEENPAKDEENPAADAETECDDEQAADVETGLSEYDDDAETKYDDEPDTEDSEDAAASDLEDSVDIVDIGYDGGYINSTDFGSNSHLGYDIATEYESDYENESEYEIESEFEKIIKLEERLESELEELHLEADHGHNHGNVVHIKIDVD